MLKKNNNTGNVKSLSDYIPKKKATSQLVSDIGNGIPDVCTFEGDDCFFRLWHDMLNTLGQGEECLMYNIDEQMISKLTGDGFYKSVQKFMDKDIEGRVLSNYEQLDGITPYCTYKHLNGEGRSYLPNYIYGDKCATIRWKDQSVFIFVLRNSDAAEKYRGLFNKLWNEKEGL